ncbi:hypothetical protein APTSU1_000039900 [Apodemus speciosus]|uniref:Uncharacterized protein n=1 Tax=Apodemus speciosus TaxID=105296 RepID=A0ABQ0EDG4_APOSI
MPSDPGFSERTCKFTGRDWEPSETVTSRAACTF